MAQHIRLNQEGEGERTENYEHYRLIFRLSWDKEIITAKLIADAVLMLFRYYKIGLQ